jgi:hypothetical protein
MADIGHSLEIGPEVLTAAIGRQRFLSVLNAADSGWSLRSRGVHPSLLEDKASWSNDGPISKELPSSCTVIEIVWQVCGAQRKARG